MDTRELISMATGGITHAYLLTMSNENNELIDNLVIGAAGGALGGLTLSKYFTGAGSVWAVAAGLIGMVAFDYFLFEV